MEEERKEEEKIEAIKVATLNTFLIPKKFVPKSQNTCIDQELRAKRIIGFANGKDILILQEMVKI